jgi:VanZ family protein
MIGIENVFHQSKPIFITITSGSKKTSMYTDGTLAQSFPRFRFGKDCTGELVIGTSPIANDSWPGKIKGLAIFQRELDPAEVFEHYESWTTAGRPNLSGNEHATAVYPFDERAGNTVHNALGSGVDLFIPKRFSLLHQPFLEPFWKEFQPTASYWGDILINIIGFIPLGFFFFAYWSVKRPIKHAALTTVVLGFAVSLTIEVLQSYLPTRFSGTTDLITNTFGTFVGVRLYASKAGRALLAKVY